VRLEDGCVLSDQKLERPAATPILIEPVH
jgi:hypothetical protein